MELNFANVEFQLLTKHLRKEHLQNISLYVKPFMKSDYIIWEALQIVWQVLSTLNFGSNVLTDIDTNGFKEENVWPSLS